MFGVSLLRSEFQAKKQPGFAPEKQKCASRIFAGGAF